MLVVDRSDGWDPMIRSGRVEALLAQALDQPPLRDVALVFALLAAVTAVAFVRRVWVVGEQNHVDD